MKLPDSKVDDSKRNKVKLAQSHGVRGPPRKRSWVEHTRLAVSQKKEEGSGSKRPKSNMRTNSNTSRKPKKVWIINCEVDQAEPVGPQYMAPSMQKTLELEDLNQSETVESVSNKIFFLEWDISDMNAKVKRLQM